MASAVADPFARFSSPRGAEQTSNHPHQQQRYLTPPFSPQSSSTNIPTVEKPAFQQGHLAHMSLPPQALFMHEQSNQQGIEPSRIPTFQGRATPQFHMPMPVGSAPLSPPANADDDTRPLAGQALSGNDVHTTGTGPPPASAGAANVKRATYNPTTTTIVRSNSHQPSMFSREQVLSPEYTLHPSIAAYQLSHPRRQLINFGPYILLQTLGEGEFGKVKLGVHREYGEEVAIKLIRRGSVDNAVRLSKVEREIDVLKTVKHPNIVRLFDVIETEKYIGIILDFANGGELFDHILAHRYLKEKDASKLFAQLISGVHYLHSKKIVHRDLKLENLLLDKHRNVIITDFGFANRFEHRKDDLMATSCGSPCYAAPELVVSDGLYVGSAVDIWSCGVILYAMLSGYLPFDDDPENPEGDNINLLYKYIINTPLTFPDWISPTARDLLQSMLVPNPEQRYTLGQVMNHPWLEAFRPLFVRSVDELEMIAQEQMQHKRQASRRDMQARMKAREAARINQLAQTAGMHSGQSQQATHQSAGPQEHQRRHKSDIPMGYVVAPGPLVAPLAHPTAEATITDQRSHIASHMTPPIITSGLVSTLKQAVSTPTAPLSGGFSGSVLAERSQATQRLRAEQDAKDDPVALEAEARAASRPRADDGSRSGPQQQEKLAIKAQGGNDTGAVPPTSRSTPQSRNRHTIQVEYDSNTAYDRPLDVQAQKTKPTEKEIMPMLVNPVSSASDAVSTTVSPTALTPTVPGRKSGDDPAPAPSISRSKSQGNTTEHMDVDSTGLTPIPVARAFEDSDKQQPATLVPSSPIMSPSVIRLVPPTPRKEPISEDITPRPPQIEAMQTVLPLFQNNPMDLEAASAASRLPVPMRLASTSTYSSSGSNPQTPRLEAVSLRPDVKISTQSRQPSVSSTASLAADLAPSPSVSVGSSASGGPASVLGKKDRSRKGLSMNSFGFGKLLSSSNSSADGMTVTGGRPQSGKETGGLLMRGGSIRQKARDRVEQKKEEPLARQPEAASSSPRTLEPLPLPSNRTPSPENAPGLLMDGSARSRNSLVIVQADKILPPHTAERSTSNVSVTQFDTFRNANRPQAMPEAPVRPHHTASSSAAQKVMNWFRRKSVVKGPFAAPLPMSREPSKAGTAQVHSNPNTTPLPSSPVQNAARFPVVPGSSKESITPAKPLQPRGESTQRDAPTKSEETPIHSPRPRRSGVSDQALLNKLPRPATVGRDLVKQTEPIAPPAAVNPITSSPFNEARLRVHVGVVDQSALTSKGAIEVIDQVQKVLLDMGIEVKRETEFKLRCMRVRRKKAGAMTGLGLSSFGNASMASMMASTTASSGSADKRGLPLPNSPSGLLSAPGGFRSMLMRRGSSQTGISGSMGSPEVGSTIESPIGSPRDGAISSNIPEPLYGEHSVDPGDEVRFSIELTRLKNLPGLLSLDIKRLRGNVWSFKFVYQTILERCDLTH